MVPEALPEPSPALPATRGILLVDDEPDIVASLETLLVRGVPGAVVHTAGSGPEALELLRRHRVELVITDQRMPDMDGLTFLHQAEQVAPGLQRILITAYPDLQIAVRAVTEARVDKYLTKPLDAAEVVAAVQDALADKRSTAHWSQAFVQSVELLRQRSQVER